MSKNLELKFTIAGGSEAELKKIYDGLKLAAGGAGDADKQVSALEKRIAELEGRLQSGHKSVKSFDDAIEELGHHLREHLVTPFGTLSGTVSSFINDMGAATVATAAVAGGILLLSDKAFHLVEIMGAASQATQNMAIRLGIGADSALKLQGAAKIVGVDVGVLEGASRLLAAALEDQSGAGAKASKALDSLGIRTIDLKGNQKEMGAVLLEVLQKLSEIDDVSKRVSLAQQLLGRSAKELQPLIVDYARLKATVAELGVEFGEADKTLVDAKEKINGLDLAWEEFKKHLGAAIAPIVLTFVSGANKLFSVGGPSLMAQETDRDRAIDEAEKHKNDYANIDKQGKAFATQNQTLEVLQKKLTSTKQEADKLFETLAKGGTPEGYNSFAEGKSAFSKATGEVARLEATIKRMQENKTFIENLMKRSQDTIHENPDGFGLDAAGDTIGNVGKGGYQQGAVRQGSGTNSPLNAAQANITKVLGEQRAELAKAGPAYAGYVATIYAPKIKEAYEKFYSELQSIIETNEKKLTETLDHEQKKESEYRNQDFEKHLKARIEEAQKAIEKTSQILGASDNADKRGATQGAGFKIKANEILTQPGGEMATEAANYQIRIGLAKQLDAIEQARIQRNFEASLDAINGVHGLIDADQEAAQIQAANDQREIDMIKAKAELDDATGKANEDQELKLLELRKQGLEDYRQAAGKVFDALSSGGRGVGAAFTSFLKDQARSIFENLTTGLFTKVGATLGSAGAASGLGGVLHGTVFDPNNAQKQLVTSQDALRQSVDNLTAQIGGSGAAPGATSTGGLASEGGLAGILSGTATAAGGAAALAGGGASAADGFGLAANGDTIGNSPSALARIFGSAKSVATAGAAGIGAFVGLMANPFGDKGGTPGVNGQPGVDNGHFTTAGVAAAGADIAVGALSAVSQFSKGGARGALGGTASILGTAAAIDPEPISKAVLGIAAMGVGLVKGLLGDPKQQRDLQENQELAAAKYTAPKPINLSIDSSGNALDSDYKGRVRVLNAKPTESIINEAIGFQPNTNQTGIGALLGLPSHLGGVITAPQRQLGLTQNTPAQPIVVQVQTLDSKSFNDNAGHIADAVKTAMQNGHPVTGTIAQMTRPK